MLEPLLDPSHRELLAEERRLLARLASELSHLEAPAEDRSALERSVAQLDELFLIVVVGEFNAGKSAFINALLGARVLEEGVTPTTSRIGLIKHGGAVTHEAAGAGLELITARVEFLRELNIVDTPGTNAVLREHEALTREFVPRSDLVLFVTSADRPFTESERAFLEAIREWGKKVVVVVNKADILDGRSDVERVTGFVRERTHALLGFEPEVFAVSARLALRGKLDADAERLADSGFPELEAYVSRSLDQVERVRLKLLNPLGVGQHVLARSCALVDGRLELLQDDFGALEALEGQLALHREDLGRDFRYRLADVEKVLLDFERRGVEYFDETLRLGRIFDLVHRERLRDEFEKKVVADLPRVVERRVDAIVDWMVASDLKLWQGVMERLQRRQLAHAENMLGGVDSRFEYDRGELIESVRREAQRAVESYDHQAEAKRLARAVREAVAGTALLQVGAIGLGAAVAALATTTFADVTGIVAAGTLSVIGLLLLPAKRREARETLRKSVTEMRRRLIATLTESFERELGRREQRLVEAIGPYTRFVRAEGDRLKGQRDALDELGDGLEKLRARIEAL